MRVVVTGANRGIGLEFVRQLRERGDVVVAAARDPAVARHLRAMIDEAAPGSRVLPCDVTSTESVRAFVLALGDEPVDMLINNAGTLGSLRALEELDLDDLVETYRVNAVGPLRVATALLPLLRRARGPRLVHISSDLSSITCNESSGWFGYRMSKAALNMASRSMAIDLRASGIISVALHPGWVQTDMGGPHAEIAPHESVRAMLSFIDGLTMEHSGSLFDLRGRVLDF